MRKHLCLCKLMFAFMFIFIALFALGCTQEKDPNGEKDNPEYTLSIDAAQKSLTLTVGDESLISPTVTAGVELVWESSKPTVVSVENGKLKALAEGTATVTVYIKDYADIKATINVTVNKKVVNPTSVKLTGSNAMVVEDEQTVVAEVLPADATDKEVVWTTSDAAIATVENGKVKALKAGTVTITATAKVDAKVKGELEITITNKVINVTNVNVTGNAIMTEGDEQTLTLEVLPADATDKEVVWTTSDAAIATVENGKVKALKAGTVTITATAHDGSEVKGELEITIAALVVTGTIVLSSEDKEAFIGIDVTINAEVTTNAADKTVVWEVSEDFGEINNGVLTPFETGEIVVNAYLKANPEIKATFTIQCYAKVSSITVGASNQLFNIGDEETFTYDVVPSAAKKDIIWSTSDDKIATIDENGLVKFIGSGSVIIKATSKDGSGKVGELTVRVRNLITDIVVDGVLLVMDVFTEQKLNITFVPEVTLEKVTFVSSNPAVASIDETGLIKALTGGKTTITITSLDAGKFVKEFEIEVRVPVANTLFDPEVANKTSGDAIDYKDMSFVVGINAFATLDEAIAASSSIVYVVPGTYDANATINKDGIKIVGPNADINPNTDTRSEEAIITGKITIAAGVKDVAINGLAFTGAGMVDCQNKVVGVELLNNLVYDTNTEVATEWLETRVEAEAVFDFWASANNGEEIKNVVIKNNKFENITEAGIMIARIYDVIVEGNVFHNFANDAIRGEGGYNYGVWTFENNEFTNDVLGGRNGIYLQSVSGIDTNNKWQEIYIKNNKFVNIGLAESTSSYNCAISFRTYQEKGLTVEIFYNEFKNCINYFNLRNNGAVADTFSCTISYNKFIGVPDGVYHRNIRPGSTDTSASNPPLTNMDYNFFLDKDENIIEDLNTVADKFVDVASFANNYLTQLEYEKAIKATLGYGVDVYVNPEWKESTYRTVNSADGYLWTYGVDGFATIAEALALATGEPFGIKFAPGTYEGDIVIDKDNITLKGNNAGINPVIENRNVESILTGKFAVSASGFTLDGFEMTGGAAVNLANGTANTTVINIVFTSTSADGVVHGPGAGEITTNVKINNNYGVTHSGNRFAWFQNVDGLEMNNNEVDALYDFLNVQGYIKGTVTINGNTFDSSLQSFIYAKGVGVINCTIEGNYIKDVANTAIDFRDMNEDGNNVFNIKYNTLINAGCGWCPIRIRTAKYDANDSITINCNFNKFIDSYYNDNGLMNFIENPSFDADNKDTPFNVIYNMDNNYYKDCPTPTSENFCGAAISWNNTYATEEEVPVYVKADEVNPTAIQITNKIDELTAGQTHLLTFALSPVDTTNKKVAFQSSDSTIAAVSSAGLITAKKEGTCTISVYSVADKKVIDTFELKVNPIERIELRYDGSAVLELQDTVQINATVITKGEAGAVTYESSDPLIAVVESNGLVTALKAGTVIITAKCGDLTATVGFTVVEDLEALNPLLKALVEGNNGVILNQIVTYIGSDDGSADYPHNIYGSANDYWAGSLPEVTQNMLPTTADNYDGTPMKSLEFIVIHDTAGSGSTSTAWANSHWCTNDTNDNSSWHYTIGNDGIYQQMDESLVTWHAGDGTSWGDSTVLQDTGVAYEGDRPEVTLGNDGYFYINGKKSLVAYPVGSTKINTLGMVCFVGDNGNYVIPTTWIGSSYGQATCARGGNLNGIGIETAINMGSDVYLTWQLTAKFVAQILVRNDLTPDRVWFHNNFSNKPCPRTMITADLVEVFLEMVYEEYNIAKNYSEYTIEFISDNQDILNNEGRVVKAPDLTTNVTYTVKITDNDGNIQTIKLNTLVTGKYN